MTSAFTRVSAVPPSCPAHVCFVRVTLLALSAVFAAASAAQTTASTSTVKIGTFTKRTVGTVIDITNGDAACYLKLKDDEGRVFEEVADFAICEKPKSLAGRRVNLSYTLDTVMADVCQGNPSCKKTKAVALVKSLTVLDSGRHPASVATAAVSPVTKGQTSFCTALETVVFSCRAGAKMASVCASRDATRGKGYLQYRFGKPDSGEPLELMLPEGQLVANKAASGEWVPYAGGAGSWLRFRKGVYSYVTYSGIGRWGPKGETRAKHGVVVEREGKLVASLKCTAEPDGEMGPEWFEKFDVKAKGDAEFFFPN